MLATLKRNWIPSVAVAAFVALLALMIWQRGSRPSEPSGATFRHGEFVLDTLDSFSAGSGSQLMLWYFNSHSVGTLTAILIVAKNGVGKEATAITCDWKTTLQEFTGRMSLLMMDGEEFGKKDHKVPMLAISFRSGKPDQTGIRTRKDSEVLLQGPFGSSMTYYLNETHRVAVEKQRVVYHFIMNPEGKTTSVYGIDVESMIGCTKNGSTAVIVVVEWSVERKPEPMLDE